MAWSRLFRRLPLDVKLIASYLVILGIGGVAISIVGSWIVSTTIWREAQRTVDHDQALARGFLEQRVDLLRRTVEVAAATLPPPDAGGAEATLGGLREPKGLDLLGWAEPGGAADALDAVAAARAGRTVAGLERLPMAGLEHLAPRLAEQARRGDARADGAGEPPASVLLLLAAAPAAGAGGRVLYGGVLLDGRLELVDALWQRLYGDGGNGAVTLFRDDVRIATTIRDATGRRVQGTRVSEPVRRAVLEAGGSWRGRAQVVGEWYLSAYEPLRDLGGRVVGMLYVGLPERTYVATRNRVVTSFFAIATLGFALVLLVTYWATQGLTRPIHQLVEATRSVAAGRFDHPLEIAPEGEIGVLAESFDRMQASLAEMRHDLEDAARTLEDKVRVRTEELAKMQVRMAQSERLASIGVLAAGVAHEINNPLGGILALTSLALEDLPADDPSRPNLEEVVRQTLRCSEIVKHLLEFSRQHQMRAEAVDLNVLLDKTLSLLERQSIFFNVRVERRFEPELPEVTADWSQLQQVFMNILLNAVQAMDERGTITVVTRHDATSGQVVIEFRDTGCGIPPEQIDRIFDPFFTTKGDGQGTGLGLSIAYGIIHRHLGTISAESRLGAGTTFTLRLPASRVVATPAAATTGSAG